MHRSRPTVNVFLPTARVRRSFFGLRALKLLPPSQSVLHTGSRRRSIRADRTQLKRMRSWQNITRFSLLYQMSLYPDNSTANPPPSGRSLSSFEFLAILSLGLQFSSLSTMVASRAKSRELAGCHNLLRIGVPSLG